MEDKNTKKPQRQTCPPCETCGKKKHLQRDTGKALQLIYVPKGLDRMKKPMTTQTTKENQRSLTTQKRAPNHLPKA